MKLDVDTLLTVPVDPPEAGPDRALDFPPPGPLSGCPAVAEVEAVAVPLLLLPQAARIAVAASKRIVTLMNVFIFNDSDVRIDIFFTSFYQKRKPLSSTLLLEGWLRRGYDNATDILDLAIFNLDAHIRHLCYAAIMTDDDDRASLICQAL